MKKLPENKGISLIKEEKYKKLKWYEYTQKFPFQYVKLIITGVLVAFIMLIQNHSLITDILQQLIDNIVK